MSLLPRRLARRQSTLGFGAAVALALAFIWSAVVVVPARAASPAGSADSVAQQAVQLDSPAVTRIVSVVDARLTCTGCATDGSDIHSPANGTAFTFYSSGSGVFISADGAILTADHVVDHSMNNSEDMAFVEQQAAQDVAQRYHSTSDQVQTYFQNHPSHVSIDFKIVFQKAFLSTAYTDNLPDTAHLYAFAITSIVASSPVDKQDTAIVRIDTNGIKPAPDFPYLTLADSQVNALDNVTAIAFPADADLALNNADFTALVDASGNDINTINSLLSPSVNSGAITKANEIRPDGTQVYEASSIASNGSSGGPVINNQGQVIGFVDAGPATDRLTFIIPSAVAAKYMTQAGVSPTSSGRFMTLWTKAFNEYIATGTCHWTSASNDLTTLKQQYPTFGAVNRYLAQAKSQAANETCATGGASTSSVTGNVTSGFLIIGGCIVALIVMILIVIIMIIAVARGIRRRAAPQRRTVAQTMQAPPAQRIATPAPVVAPAHVAPRMCPNGHAVYEADAAYCPQCGAPMLGAAGR
ncbi:MAG TPA: serine protease [Ktedonobacterales bacterium]